jgi:hypothetical protein
MSQALAQSATQLTKSNGLEEWLDIDFFNSATKAAGRKVGKDSVALERYVMKREAIASAVAADYRAHQAGLFGRSDRLPSAIMDKCYAGTDKFIAQVMAMINPSNIITARRAFYHDVNDNKVTERCTIVGENLLDLKKQHLGILLFKGQAEKRLKAFQTEGKPDHDREVKLENAVRRCEQTMAFIEGEMAHLAKSAAE